MPLFAGQPIAVRYIVKYMQGVYSIKCTGVRWAVRALLLWLTVSAIKAFFEGRSVHIDPA
jgi:hypothetical protein